MKHAPINENNATNTMTLYKDYLVYSYDLANKHLPNTNYEVKDKVDVLKRMQCRSHNEKDQTAISNLN